MTDVFLSYAREDTGEAERLARLLTSNGLDVWWDRRLDAGDDINVVIERALEQAKCVIVIWSPHSVGSNWVRGEAQAALDGKKYLPVQIAECKLPINVGHIHTPQIYKSANELDKLAARLTERLSSTKRSSTSNPKREIVFAPETTASFLSDYRDAYDQHSFAEVERRHPGKSNLYWGTWAVGALAIYIAYLVFGAFSMLVLGIAEVLWFVFMFFLPEIVGSLKGPRKG